MAYDEKLLLRIRQVLSTRNDVVEKKMFGGVAFMVNGHMACGPHHDNLILRLGREASDQALQEPHVRPMDFTGKVMKSFVMVEAAGLRTERQLRRWVELAAAFASSSDSVPKSRQKRSPRK